MTEENILRRRIKEEVKENGEVYMRQGEADPEFKPRESPLTYLRETSPHIRAIYHIFVAILIILLFDTVTYDLVEHGKINVGIRVVIDGFGDIRRCIKLWLCELCVALLFYPGLRLYEFGAKALKKYPVIQKTWTALAIFVLMILQATLMAGPIRDLKKNHLAIASGVTATLEMLRFAMKIHSVAVACGPRCLRDIPLPSFQHYVYFLFAPTLIYRDQYPRTKKIRWLVVATHLMEVVAIIFYNSFLWERFILPYWSDYGKEETVEVGKVVRGMFACVLPGILSFLCGFYCLLHAWLNAFAEMMKFADRLFYEEWWTQSQFSKYYRAWNRVVHAWLRYHIFRPLAPATGRAVATFTVFFISSVAHELVLALSFGFFYPVLLMQFGVFGLICVPLTATTGRRFPNMINLMMWLAFFCGNGILWSLYPMEHFARKNCPPSENDSFFVPKSWSCPQIVLKQNWTFHNPFDLSK